MASILHLGKRLESIVELCPQTKVIADIGCDHGYVTAELVLENKANMVIATDKSASCLNKAISLADSINITQFISFREGSGFDPITKYDKIDCAVIAGMGGSEIIDILQKKPKKLYDFVLQPMKDVQELRYYLVQNKFKIVVDIMVKENDKFYNIICTTKGRDKLDDLEIMFGRTNFTDNQTVLMEYLIERKSKLLDFKSKAGELGAKLQTELEYVEHAIAMLEAEQKQSNAK